MSSAHLVLDLAAYMVGFHFYRVTRTPSLMTPRQAAVVLGFAIMGGLFGARFPSVVDSYLGSLVTTGSPPSMMARFLLADKTVVGGLVFGTLFVELGKRLAKVRTRTGDDVVFPLIVAIAIGRLGCFFAGLGDNTFGLPTALPWGVEFGDDVPRHPTQIYEIVFLAALGAAIHYRKKSAYAQGDLFRGFMVAYALFRLFVDLLKPFPLTRYEVAGDLSSIQILCVAVICAYAPAASRLIFRRSAPAIGSVALWNAALAAAVSLSWGCIGVLGAALLNQPFDEYSTDEPLPGTFYVELTPEDTETKFRVWLASSGSVNLKIPEQLRLEVDGVPLSLEKNSFKGKRPRALGHKLSFFDGDENLGSMQFSVPLKTTTLSATRRGTKLILDFALPDLAASGVNVGIYARGPTGRDAWLDSVDPERDVVGGKFRVVIARKNKISRVCLKGDAPHDAFPDASTRFGYYIQVSMTLACAEAESQ